MLFSGFVIVIVISIGFVDSDPHNVGHQIGENLAAEYRSAVHIHLQKYAKTRCDSGLIRYRLIQKNIWHNKWRTSHSIDDCHIEDSLNVASDIPYL